MNWEYIPQNDTEAVEWMKQFLEAASAIATQLGVTPDELTPLANAVDRDEGAWSNELTLSVGG